MNVCASVVSGSFLIRRNRTKRANVRGNPLFQATYNNRTRKFTRFVLFRLIKKRSFKLLRVFDQGK